MGTNPGWRPGTKKGRDYERAGSRVTGLRCCDDDRSVRTEVRPRGPIVACRWWRLRLLPLTTNLVGVEILASARRHGISDDDIRHAVENSLAGGRSDDQTDFVMLVGPDQSGNLIEVGIVVTHDIEYAIHAMRARNRYLEWL